MCYSAQIKADYLKDVAAEEMLRRSADSWLVLALSPD